MTGDDKRIMGRSSTGSHTGVNLLAAFVLSWMLGGCGASTSYRPRHGDHVYLVLKDGLPSYYLNGDVHPWQSDPAVKLLACSDPARRHADTANDKATAAKTLTTAGVLFGIVGAFLFTPIAVSMQDGANAHAIDAMNVYNETPRCSTPPHASAVAVAAAANGGQR